MNAAIIFVAQYLVIVFPLALLQLIWTLPRSHRLRLVALSILALLIAYMLAKITSHLYNDPRPYIAGDILPLVPGGVDNGFPSLHTTFAATAAALVFTERKKLGTALFILAAMIGTARVLAGVHHLIDIPAGLICAAAAVLIARALLNISAFR